jgi:hypothetical protein
MISIVRRLFSKVYPAVEKISVVHHSTCSSFGDLFLDALFILMVGLGGYKEVSGQPAMLATENTFPLLFAFVLLACSN